MRPKLAILITCHNRKFNTLACIKSIYSSIKDGNIVIVDIFLVDDGSTDGTAEAVSEAYPAIKILKGDGTLYWGRGMIKAWEEAAKYEYDFFVWMNDDTYLMPDAIEKLLDDSAKFNYEAIIAGVCKAVNENVITYSGYLLKDKKRMEPQGTTVLCDFFNGNVVLIPVNVFKKVGFLDQTFHHLLGDIDYGLRAKKHGIDSYISSEVIAVCDAHDALPKWCNPRYSLMERIKHFKTPLSKNPRQVYIFEKRHTSLLMALFRSNIIYIRLIFPTLWIWIGKADFK